MKNGVVTGIAWCLDFQCTEYRFKNYTNETSGEIHLTDPTGFRAALRAIDQAPWCEIEKTVEPSVIVCTSF